MRHVFRVSRLLGATVALVAVVPAVFTTVAAVSKSAALPPCAAGRIVNAVNLSLSDCSISGNVAAGSGGGIENYGTLHLTNVVISGNTGARGGGIYNGPGASATLTNVTLSGNVATGRGGGFFNDGGTVILSSVTITENTAGTGGGGIANISGSMAGAGLAVIDNETLAGDGGGILNHSSLCLAPGNDNTVCFANPAGGGSLVSDNEAAGNGGGIANRGNFVLGHATVDGNSSAGGNGGGLWNFEGTIYLSNVTISNNTTSGNGGGLFNEFGSVCCGTVGTSYAFNNTIAKNHADGDGGGVFTTGAFTGLSSSTIADNTADGSGGGVANDDPSGAFTELKDSLLARNEQNCAGSVFSSGHNLDTGVTCGFAETGDWSDVQDSLVGLGTLAANGGPARGNSEVSEALQTLAIGPSSPAVNAGSDSCPALDERGVARPSGLCDIGAFELESSGETTVVTATITAANRPYDSTTAATITECTLTGVPGTADVGCEASGATFNTADVGIGKPVTATVTLTGTAAGNYELSLNTATTSAEITPAPASVTPDIVGKAYGVADPALTGTLSGFFAADAVTATYSRTAGESVAGSAYTISATLSASATTGNYFVTYNTSNFTISKAAASVTPNVNTKVYGADDPAFTGTLSGFLAADGVTPSYSRTAGETVAGGPYVISATLSPSAALDNYEVTYNTANFTITKASASVSPAAASKVYGAVDPAFTGTLGGFNAADGVSASYSRSAGENVAGSPYAISATLSPAGVLGNYAIAYNTAAFTITPATPIVTWATPAAIASPTPLGGTQLNATASTPGTFAYTPTAGTVLNAGIGQLLSVLFTPTDNSNYTAATAQVQITVVQPSKASCPDDSAAVLTRAVDRTGAAHGSVPVYTTVQAAYNAAVNGDVIGMFTQTSENVVLGGSKTLTITQCSTAKVRASDNSKPVWNITSTGALTIIGPDAVGGTIGWRIGTSGHNLKDVGATGASQFGILVAGNNNVVSVNSVTGNEVGIRVTGDANDLAPGGAVFENAENGVEIGAAATGNTVRIGSIHGNGGNGIRIDGDENTVTGNSRVDDNSGHGLLINGDNNTITNNASGSERNKGNGQAGFRVEGNGNTLESNSANANGTAGFNLVGTGNKLKGNQSNQGVQDGARENTGPEYRFANNSTLDLGGNKKDKANFVGTLIGLRFAAGSFE